MAPLRVTQLHDHKLGAPTHFDILGASWVTTLDGQEAGGGDDHFRGT